MGNERPEWPGFWASLDDEARRALLDAGTERFYRAGRGVYEEGRAADTLAILLEGRVKVSTTTRSGNELLLAIRGAGDPIGELSTLLGEDRGATVSAIDDVRLLVVPYARFEELGDVHPQLRRALTLTLAHRLREADASRVDLEQDIDERVARQLRSLSGRFGVPGGDGSIEIQLPLSQDELAGLTWASRGAVAGALARLRSASVISTARRRIVILDPQRL